MRRAPSAKQAARREAQLLRELDYVRRLVAIDHVGLGTDMAGLPGVTSSPSYREVAPLPAALLARDLSDAEVRKVLGGNLVRVFETASAGR